MFSPDFDFYIPKPQKSTYKSKNSEILYFIGQLEELINSNIELFKGNQQTYRKIKSYQNIIKQIKSSCYYYMSNSRYSEVKNILSSIHESVNKELNEIKEKKQNKEAEDKYKDLISKISKIFDDFYNLNEKINNNNINFSLIDEEKRKSIIYICNYLNETYNSFVYIFSVKNFDFIKRTISLKDLTDFYDCINETYKEYNDLITEILNTQQIKKSTEFMKDDDDLNDSQDETALDLSNCESDSDNTPGEIMLDPSDQKFIKSCAFPASIIKDYKTYEKPDLTNQQFKTPIKTPEFIYQEKQQQDQEIKQTKDIELKENVNEPENEVDWKLINELFYYSGDKVNGHLKVFKQKDEKSRLIKFEMLVEKTNCFNIIIYKNYNIINQYLELKGFDPVFKYNKLEYITTYDSDYDKKVADADKLIKFIIADSDNFYNTIINKDNTIKQGIKEIQSVIDSLTAKYSDIPDINNHIKRVFTDLINHEFVEKKSLDYAIVYYPIDQLKKKYNYPEIWKLENYKFD